MTTAVLDVARRELGTVEAPPQSNRQKYGKAYGWDGQAWCMQFAWWVITQAGQAAAVPKTASTVAARTWYLGRGQWLEGRDAAAQPGDLVFFRFAGNKNVVNHVGLVEAVEPNGTLITIEGNTAGTAAGDQRNGGMVARKRRTRTDVVGFARPAYGATSPAAARPTLREGDTGPDVESWQEFLRRDGARIDRVTPPRFGPQTKTATRAWQARNGLVNDGVVGPISWRKAVELGFTS